MIALTYGLNSKFRKKASSKVRLEKITMLKCIFQTFWLLVVRNGTLNAVFDSRAQRFWSRRGRSTNSTETEFCRLSTQWANQLSKLVDNANILRRFDSSTNVFLSTFEICLPAKHYLRTASTLRDIIQVLEKYQLFKEPTQILYVLRNLALLVAFSERNLKLRIRH